MISSLSYAGGDYDAALGSARDALYIQSGARDFVKDLEKYGASQVRSYALDWGIEREILFLGSAAYSYRKRQVEIPLCCEKKLILSPGQIMLQFRL